eukprot:366501-Chlamydomonas_euryale.AAC.7
MCLQAIKSTCCMWPQLEARRREFSQNCWTNVYSNKVHLHQWQRGLTVLNLYLESAWSAVR